MTPEQVVRERILSHKKLREDAESLVALAGEQPEKFWRLLADVVASKLPADIEPPAMTTEQAHSFERQPIPFGKHAGFPIGEVPVSYLLWLTEQPDEFRTKLRQYVKTSVFAERQETEDHDP